MTPDNFHNFFLASGGVAGALIGLLFVAISVSAERLSSDTEGAQFHRVRASAALTAFLNALSVSLFALVPGELIGGTSLVVAVVGLMFVTASLLSLLRLREMSWSAAPDAVFLIALSVVFVIQVIAGASVLARPDNPGSVGTIAILVIVCFLIGVGRAWDLVGGPSIGLIREIVELIRHH